MAFAVLEYDPDAQFGPSREPAPDELLLLLDDCAVPVLRAEIGEILDKIVIHLEVPVWSGGVPTCGGYASTYLNVHTSADLPVFGVNTHGELVGPLEPIPLPSIQELNSSQSRELPFHEGFLG